MRDSYEPARNGGGSVMTWLLSGIIAGFILQNVFLRWFNAGAFFDGNFALSPYAIATGKVWTLLTYGFLHDPRNLLHILANVLAIYFLGRELLPLLGARRFVGVYLAMVLTGGLFWLAANWANAGMVIGASAAACGLLIIYAGFYPHRPITFLLFFILPVTLKPKHVAITLLLLDLAGFAFYEILGAASPFGVAHSAHLGGMFAGWIYFRYVHERAWPGGPSCRRTNPRTRSSRPRIATSAPRSTAFSTRSTAKGSARSPRKRSACSTTPRTCSAAVDATQTPLRRLTAANCVKLCPATPISISPCSFPCPRFAA